METSEAVEIRLLWTFIDFSETRMLGARMCDVECAMRFTAKLISTTERGSKR
jgi:hypothetical protein